MSAFKAGAAGAYLCFVVLACAFALAVVLAGQAVALERGGQEAARAWRLGAGVSLVSSLIAGLLVAVSGRLKVQGVTMALGSMLLRLVILGMLGTAAVVMLSLEVRSFLLAVAVSYLALLVVDTGYALYASARVSGSP
jgi:hypothetical protein